MARGGQLAPPNAMIYVYVEDTKQIQKLIKKLPKAMKNAMMDTLIDTKPSIVQTTKDLIAGNIYVGWHKAPYETGALKNSVRNIHSVTGSLRGKAIDFTLKTAIGGIWAKTDIKPPNRPPLSKKFVDYAVLVHEGQGVHAGKPRPFADMAAKLELKPIVERAVKHLQSRIRDIHV